MLSRAFTTLSRQPIRRSRLAFLAAHI